MPPDHTSFVPLSTSWWRRPGPFLNDPSVSSWVSSSSQVLSSLTLLPRGPGLLLPRTSATLLFVDTCLFRHLLLAHSPLSQHLLFATSSCPDAFSSFFLIMEFLLWRLSRRGLFSTCPSWCLHLFLYLSFLSTTPNLLLSILGQSIPLLAFVVLARLPPCRPLNILRLFFFLLLSLHRLPPCRLLIILRLFFLLLPLHRLLRLFSLSTSGHSCRASFSSDRTWSLFFLLTLFLLFSSYGHSTSHRVRHWPRPPNEPLSALLSLTPP